MSIIHNLRSDIKWEEMMLKRTYCSKFVKEDSE